MEQHSHLIITHYDQVERRCHLQTIVHAVDASQVMSGDASQVAAVYSWLFHVAKSKLAAALL
jgi:hypothetical protein